MPYIGVTGLTTEKEVSWLVWRLANCHRSKSDGTLKPGRCLVVGVLVSDKTMRGEENRWPNRFPSVSQIASIFKTAFETAEWVGGLMTICVAHYNTHDPDTLGAQLSELHSACGRYNSGVQLNVRWPQHKQLEEYRQGVPADHRVILQLGSRAMDGLSPEQIGEKVAEYGDLITDVLVDPSGGKGLPFEPLSYSPVLDAILQATSGRIGLGYAGGLSSESAGALEALHRRYPNISIDAEGRLRDCNDKLDLAKAIGYVETAISAIHNSRKTR